MFAKIKINKSPRRSRGKVLRICEGKCRASSVKQPKSVQLSTKALIIHYNMLLHTKPNRKEDKQTNTLPQIGEISTQD
jgi:sulfatase maturation enzyme AslB (radical SAM superfamily)